MCLPRKFKWLCDIPSDTTRKGTSMNHNLHKRRVGKKSNLKVDKRQMWHFRQFYPYSPKEKYWYENMLFPLTS